MDRAAKAELVGNHVRGLRNRRKLSQDKLAALIDISAVTLRRIESGRAPLSVVDFLDICAALDINPGEALDAIQKDLDRITSRE